MTNHSATTHHDLPGTPPRRRTWGIAALAAVMVVVPASSAQASPGVDAIWMECIAGTVSTHHSMADYQAALVNIPADVAEYGDCTSLIKAAELASTRPATPTPTPGQPAPSSGHGSAPTTGTFVPEGKTISAPALATALQAAGVNAEAPVGQSADAPSGDAAKASIGPGAPSIDLAAARAPSVAGAVSLPTPILASVIAVLLMSLLPLARAIAGRLPRREG